MAGTGKAPKARRTRARDNKDDVEIERPPEAGAPEVPEWPLGEDAALKARQHAVMERLAKVNEQIEEETNGRKLGGLRRQQKAAEGELAVLDMQVSVAASVELEIWRDLWSLPQSDIWRAQGWSRDIAQYARHKARGECGSLDDAKEARQWSDRLGLNPRAAAQMGVKIRPERSSGSATPSTPSKSSKSTVTDLGSRRDRLTG